MNLERRLEDEIREAISQYKAVCKDPSNLTGVDTNIIDGMRRVEFLTEFIRLKTIEDREQRTKRELIVYEKIKDSFGCYIGFRLISRLNLSINIPRDVYALVGRIIIDDNF